MEISDLKRAVTLLSTTKGRVEPKILDFSRTSKIDRSQFCSPDPCLMIMHGSSFESIKPYLFVYYLMNSIAVVLRYVI